MGYFPVRYDSRVVNYDRRGFIRLATGGGMANIPTLSIVPLSRSNIFLCKPFRNFHLIL